MKVTEFKDGVYYLRISDNTLFKKEGSEYFKCNAKGYWDKTDDIKISDQFKINTEISINETFESMFNKYRSGDAESQRRYLDALLLGMARVLDKQRK